MVKVFLAYSGYDRSILLTILKNLKINKEKYYLWYYMPGKNNVPMEKIPEVIAGMDIFLMLLSNNSLKSANVLKELELASEEKQIKEICPITIDNELHDKLTRYLPADISNNIYYSNAKILVWHIIEGILKKY